MGVLTILIIMLAGSIVATFLVPPFLFKIQRTGEVNFFGIRFPPPG
jgi:hypothetical protein